jgi:rhodanese-related sulfurtransferase
MTNQLSTHLQSIKAETLKQWLDHNQAMLVDVREPAEYAAERINGAKSVPLSQFDVNQIPVETGKSLVLCCQTGNRSAQAAKKLLTNGVETVINLEGGLNAWKQSGYATQININAPISMFRQVQIVAGSLVFVGTILGEFVSPWFLILSGFVGAGLVFAGVSNTCAMAALLAKLPYNQLRKR